MELCVDKMAHDVVDKALDEVEYNGKTLRQWVDVISKAQWVSVKDELPPINEKVLVFAVGKDDGCCTIDITQYTDCLYGLGGSYGWIAPRLCYFNSYRITHWMPLPELPKEDNL